jgi:hypothetical protein
MLRFAARSWAQSKGFHSPSASELLLFAWSKRSNQEKDHPKAVVSGHPALRLRGRASGFADSTSVCWQRTGRDPSRPPCGPFLRPAATAYGARLARILRARAKSQSQSQSALIRLRHLLPPSGRRKIRSKSEAASAGLRESASSWLRRRRSDRGPYAVAQRRREGPKGGSQGCEPVGCQSRDGLSANPGAAARSRRAGCPETAASGWPSLWLLSLGHARESDSLAAGE